MKKRDFVIESVLILTVLFILIISPFLSAGEIKSDLKEIINKTPVAEKVPVIILFNEKPTTLDMDAIKSEGANIKHQYTLMNAVAVQVQAQAIERIAKKSFVKLIEPDYKVELVLDKSIPQIQANKVWASNLTGKNIDVAVIDTGIHDEHPALVIKIEIDYTGEGTDDLNGHGTHVAGIIASTDSVYRGVAYDSNLFNVKVLNQYGSGYGSDVIKGIEWATDNGAEIISMSLGAVISPCDGTDAISQAVDKAMSKGVVVVVAAGNLGPNSGTITSPGCSKTGITVGAVDDYDNVASFSSRGPTSDGRVKPDIVAPGVGIISTWKDNSFKSLSGTSMSTPHVSGVAALLLEIDSSLSPADVKNNLKTTALNLGLDENTQGAGRVDAYNAYVFLTNITKEPTTNETEENETKKNDTQKIIPGLDKGLKKGRGKPGTISYEFSMIRERMQLAFAFNKVKKAEMYLNFAERRLSESLEVSEDEQRETLLKRYQENLEQSKMIAERARENGKDTLLIEERIAKATTIHEEVLKEVLENAPEQAKPAIQGAIDSSRKGNEESLNALERSYPEKAAEVYYEIAGENLNRMREKINEGNVENVEEMMNEYEYRITKSSEIVEAAKELGNNTTDIERVIAESASAHLEILSEIQGKISEETKPSVERAIDASTSGREKAIESLKEKGVDSSRGIDSTISKSANSRTGVTGRVIDFFQNFFR